MVFSFGSLAAAGRSACLLMTRARPRFGHPRVTIYRRRERSELSLLKHFMSGLHVPSSRSSVEVIPSKGLRRHHQALLPPDEDSSQVQVGPHIRKRRAACCIARLAERLAITGLAPVDAQESRGHRED